MRRVRQFGLEVVFVALLVSAGSAVLGVVPRLQPEAVGLAVLFLSHLAVLAAATFLLLRSSLAGWWLAGVAVAALAGFLLADGLERVVLGACATAVAPSLVVRGGCSAVGLVLLVLLLGGRQGLPLRLERAQLMAALGPAAALAAAYSLAYGLVGWAFVAAGWPYLGRQEHRLAVLLAAGAARGVVMVACTAPLLLTLLGRRSKNSRGVGALLAAGTLAAHLAAARSLTSMTLAGAAVQAVLSFFLGAALVRLTRPPIVERESSSRWVAVQEASTPPPPEQG